MKNFKIIFVLSSLFLVGCQEETQTAALKNIAANTVPLPADRGIIYDKNSRILAENRTASYYLEIISGDVTEIDLILDRLKSTVEISQKGIIKQHKGSGLPLLIQVSEAGAAKFTVVKDTFPGVKIHKELIRFYPFAELTAHVVGYVERINEQEMKDLPEAEYRGIHTMGKTGIERSYENILRGHAGYAEFETNAQGKASKELGVIEAMPGADIYLTLDIDLQKTAYDALGDFNGGVVALDIETGGVLAQVSKSSFDPNLFVAGIGSRHHADLNSSENKPLFDRVIQGQYSPGSTMKPFIGLAGLEHNIKHEDQALFCPGYYQLPGKSHKYRDWKKVGHGKVDLDAAITQSCDVYFYDLSLALGIDRMAGFLQQFGFGQKTGVDLKGEKSGLLPSREWKRIHRDQPWFPGETLITGIGQGFTQVTLMQLASATAALANQGKFVVPHLAERIIEQGREVELDRPAAKNIPLKVSNVQDIIDAMVHVVHSPEGTANGIAKGFDYQIAGKTGTAQVYTVKQDERYNEEEIAFNMRDHALFIAFAPADDPKIAVAVIVEHGGDSSVASRIAAKVIEHYLQGEMSVGWGEERTPAQYGTTKT